MDTPSLTLMRKRMVLEYNSSIGRAISELRESRGLNQNELGAEFGFEQSLISKLESGQRSLKFAEMVLLARSLDISSEELAAYLINALPGDEE